MAQPYVYSGTKLLVQMGDGGSPETFAAPCGINTRGINLTKETNDVTVPDCDNPDAPAWTARDVLSLSGEVTGAGIFTKEAAAVWRSAYLSTSSVNCRIRVDDTGANQGGYFAGKFHLTALNITGERGSKIQCEITLVSDGQISWVAAA